MSAGLALTPDVVAAVRGELEAGRHGLADCAEVPGLDAGAATGLLLGMLSRVSQAAATVAGSLGAAVGQVDEVARALAETDAAVATAYGQGRAGVR